MTKIHAMWLGFLVPSLALLLMAQTSPPTTRPGGSSTQVQYNNSGSFGGDSGLTYNAGTDTLSVGSNVTVGGNSVCLSTGIGCPGSTNILHRESSETGGGFTGFSSAPSDCTTEINSAVDASTLRTVTTYTFRGSDCDGTSNATTMTLPSGNSNFCPLIGDRVLPIVLINNGTTQLGRVRISELSAGNCTLTFGATVAADGGFTAAGTKGFPLGSSFSF